MHYSQFIHKIGQYIYRNMQEICRPEVRALRSLKRSIGHFPRRYAGRVTVWGWDLNFVDAASCISSFDYISVRKWNDFITENPRPRILDCGANIGISVLNYKRQYPYADITAFEPDPLICEVLRKNLKINNVSGVKVIEAALWDSEREMSFIADGADGGFLSDRMELDCLKVKTQCLSGYLGMPIDLLKIDIEGAETRVIKECGHLFFNVHNLIIEYHPVNGVFCDLSYILSILEHNGFYYYINSYGCWKCFANEQNKHDGYNDQLLMIYAKKGKTWEGNIE